MSTFKLIVGIVQKNLGETITHAATEVGARGATITLGKGVAPNSILEMLGLFDTEKEIIYIITTSDDSKKIIEAMQNCVKDKKAAGIVFTLNVNEIIKAGKITTGDKKMSESSYQLLTIIVNKGFADATMDAARKAGATGGTILKARGTAREGDPKFLGIEIVPEKDMIMILADSTKAPAIIDAINALPCLSKPGSGIAFATPAEDFTILGKK